MDIYKYTHKHAGWHSETSAWVIGVLLNAKKSYLVKLVNVTFADWKSTSLTNAENFTEQGVFFCLSWQSQ